MLHTFFVEVHVDHEDSIDVALRVASRFFDLHAFPGDRLVRGGHDAATSMSLIGLVDLRSGRESKIMPEDVEVKGAPGLL